MPDILSMWTVYDSPADVPPGWFVARRFEITGKGPVPTDDTVLTPDLGVIRGYMEMRGLHRMPREEGDQAQIVESWI